MSRPSFQFYPRDWVSNKRLRKCSLAERGAWVDVLCVLHDEAEYGVSRDTLEDIAKAAIVPLATIRGLVAKGVLKGSDEAIDEPYVYTPRHGRKNGTPVVLVPAQAGPVWFSTRMVRDEYVRQNAGKSTRFGASPPSPGRAPSRRDGADQGDGSASASASAIREGGADYGPGTTTGEEENALMRAGSTPSAGAVITLALKRFGIFGNPSDPTLRALLDAGATVDEFTEAAPDATGRSKPWPYLLAMVTERRKRAAEIASSVHRGPIPARESERARAARERIADLTGGLASAPDPSGRDPLDTIDEERPLHGSRRAVR